MSSDTVTQPAQSRSAPAPGWRRRLRAFGYVPRREPGVTERLVPPYRRSGARLLQVAGVPAATALRIARLGAWGGPLLVALFAGVLRFVNLSSPRAVIFDETYYAKDAWSLLQLGYEGSWPKDANDKLLDDPQVIPLSEDPGYVVHPPVGKWMIALGEWAFGLEPFGWRFVVALLGTLSVLMLCRIGRRLFRSTLLGCLAGLLLAVDGLHFVMSRTALLDLVLMFWVLAAFGCLLVDRDRARERLAAALPAGRPDDAVASGLRLGARPWRLAAGVCMGLALGTKWNALFILAAFGLLTVLWDAGARRTAGSRRPYARALRLDVVPAFFSTVPVAAAVYVASWTGWFASDNGYFRGWAEDRDTAFPFIPDAVRSLWHYHAVVYRFHVNLDSGHTYDSNPWSWPVVGRPVSYFWDDPRPGEDGCPADATENCAREVLALGTPLLWWLGVAAAVYALYRWGLRRDWRAGAILCGLAAGWVPWLFYQERTIFLFYAVVFVPYLCLAVTMMLGAMARAGTAALAGQGTPASGSGPAPGPAQPTEWRRAAGVVAAGVLVLLVLWNFIYFWPIYTGETITRDAWEARMWLGSWV